MTRKFKITCVAQHLWLALYFIWAVLSWRDFKSYKKERNYQRLKESKRDAYHVSRRGWLALKTMTKKSIGQSICRLYKHTKICETSNGIKALSQYWLMLIWEKNKNETEIDILIKQGVPSL